MHRRSYKLIYRSCRFKKSVSCPNVNLQALIIKTESNYAIARTKSSIRIPLATGGNLKIEQDSVDFI